jgi:hypothetical protein
MPTKIVKPIYESIRYDIRPSSGLTDVESDYLNSCVSKLQNHPNCAEVGIAFEMSTAHPNPRSTTKHAHIFTRWKTGIRSDKMPILQMAKYIKQRQWSNKAVMTVTTANWTPAHYWKAGYIQKEGASVGNMRNYVEFWNEHERLMKAKKVRVPLLSSKTDADELVNFWYASHTLIRTNHTKHMGITDNMGMTHTPPLDIRHVWAQYLITYHCNCTDERRRAERLWLLTATWRDYQTLVDKCTATTIVEQAQGNDRFDDKFESVPRVYSTMDEIFPISEGI